MDDKTLLLHSRQILMPQIGVEQQRRLADSTVVIVGAGGLGCSVAQSLSASGVGRLIIIDDDVIELSNIPRQVLFSEADIGQSKANVVCQRLSARLSTTQCIAYSQCFSEALMDIIMQRFAPQVIVDAGDNLALSLAIDNVVDRYPMVLSHAAVSGFEGYLYLRLPSPDFPTLKTLFQQQSLSQSCSQSGVLSVAVSIVASYQAGQIIHALLRPLWGGLTPEFVLFEGATMRFLPIAIRAD